MSALTVDFRRLDLLTASDHEYECLSKFKNILHHESRPDDPPIPLSEHVQGWKNIPAFIEYEIYTAWDESNTNIIAECEIVIAHTGDNEHLAEIEIEVLPEYRRQGIGRQALKQLLPFAKKNNRTMLLPFSLDTVPAAARFLERLGARKGLENHINQLKISEFDRSLVERWLKNGEALHNEFELGLWDSAYPDSHIINIADLFQVVANDSPRDSLEMEDMNFTPERLRQMEKGFFASGNFRWTMHATNRATGKLAGLSELFWNPNRKMILNQGFTGVYPEYRNKGLGRWLKAAMMDKILRERAEVEFIRTTNANSNAPMLKINHEMGFKPYIASIIWQVETEKVERYIEERK